MKKLWPILFIGIVLALSACSGLAGSNNAAIAETTPGADAQAAVATAAEPNDTPVPVSEEAATGTPAPTEEAQSPADTPASLTEEDIIAPTPSGKSLQPQLGQASIDVNQIQVLLPPDAIRAVFPEEVADIMVTAEEAEAAGIDPKVQIMGVSIDGDSRAYPIPFLSRHEIVNDEVGGKLIAATW